MSTDCGGFSFSFCYFQESLKRQFICPESVLSDSELVPPSITNPVRVHNIKKVRSPNTSIA